MENTKFYLNKFHDEVMNLILNAPTDEPTITYFTDCLNEIYDNILESVNNDK